MLTTNNICLICNDEKEQNELSNLKCNHSFCWKCINCYLNQNLQPKIKCPIKNCNVFIRDSQIRRVLQDELIEKYENLCIGNIDKVHKCLLPECPESIIYTDPEVQYQCHTCKLYNCIKCKAPHNFFTCSQYQAKNNTEKTLICQQELRFALQSLNDKHKLDTRNSLEAFENVDLLSNQVVFECKLCSMIICKGDGVKLRNCSHLLCRPCLTGHINTANVVPVLCPMSYCKNIITDREIQSILSRVDLNSYQTKCANLSKKAINSFYQCQTPNCQAFYEFESKLKEFVCRKCQNKNCTECKTIHTNESCQEYRNKMQKDVTLKSIESRILNGQVMRCLDCKVLLEKVSGCNWVKCHNCSLELCWVLKMRRWGPKGQGDTSGGCKCGVNGVRCHTSCFSSCTPHNR